MENKRTDIFICHVDLAHGPLHGGCLIFTSSGARLKTLKVPVNTVHICNCKKQSLMLCRIGLGRPFVNVFTPKKFVTLCRLALSLRYTFTPMYKYVTCSLGGIRTCVCVNSSLYQRRHLQFTV